MIQGKSLDITATQVRLSTYVLFVDYGAEIEVQHTVRSTVHRIARAVYEDLLQFCAFHPPQERHTPWIAAGILVPPYSDTHEYHGGLQPKTEAQLAQDYQAWYWRHEVEAEREYQWLGWSIVKMPTDLFFYQELMERHRLRSILEIGYGEGGGLWFFATILRLLGGGQVVGVDHVEPSVLPPLQKLDGIRFDLIHGDAHIEKTSIAARTLRPQGFDLVVIDADPQPERKLKLLARWAPLVAAGGYLVLEDVESPACRQAGQLINVGVDDFLLGNRTFEIATKAARFPLMKARGAILRRS